MFLGNLIICLLMQKIVYSDAFYYDLLDYWYSNDDGIVRSGEIGFERYTNENYSSIPNKVALRTKDNEIFEVELINDNDKKVNEGNGEHGLVTPNKSVVEDIVENNKYSTDYKETWQLTTVNPKITEISDTDIIVDDGLIDDSTLPEDDNYNTQSTKKGTDEFQVSEDHYLSISPIKELFDKIKVSYIFDYLRSVSKCIIKINENTDVNGTDNDNKKN